MILLQGVAIIVLMAELVLLVYLIIKKEEKAIGDFSPIVTIIIAVRNEESGIAATIESLLNQDYPKDKLKILVGDDHSEDNTASIVKSAVARDSRVTYFKVDPENKVAEGKAGVLDLLIHQSEADYIMIGDGDMQYPKEWVRNMVLHSSREERLISGFTGVQVQTLWDSWQNLDWLLNLIGVKLLDDAGFRFTAMGNNMCFPMKAYKEIPGFSKMKNTVTEDMELLRQMETSGTKSKLIFSGLVLATTNSVKTFKAILIQRIRWMSGAFQSPWWLRIGWFCRVIILPVLIVIALLNVQFGLWLILIHYFLFIFTVLILYRKLHIKASFSSIISFEIFYFLMNIFSLVKYLTRSKIDWKGKEYKI